MRDLWWIIIIFLFLTVISLCDLKTQRVSGVLIIANFIVSIAFLLYKKDSTFVDCMVSCTPGCFLLIVSILTKEKIGMGDALLLIELGIAFGLELCVYGLMFALIGSFVISGILLILKKVNLTTRIPFVPFLTIGMGVSLYVFR